MTTYIADTDHYSQVIAQIPKVKRLLWIATADLKDLYVEKKSGAVVPLLQILNDLVKKGVEVRLIHAKEPGTAFREDFDKYPALWGGMERRLCPRVHMKIIVMDSNLVYVGSANLTGAGMGMKSAANRNCNEPQKLNTKLLGFVICTRNIQLKNVYWLYKNA